MKNGFLKTIEISLILLSTILMLAPPSMARDVKRIILMETMPVPSILEHSKYFQMQLKKMGYDVNYNLELTVLKPDGDRALAERLLKNELNKGAPDLVVTIATLASQAAMKLLKGTAVPILFFHVSDPVGAGLIKRIDAPTGANITGKVHTISRKAKIEMVLRLVNQGAVHKPIRFGFIHSTYPSSLGDIKELMKIGKTNENITFVPYEIRYRAVSEGLPIMIEETRKAIEKLKDDVDYWIEPMGPLGETTEYTNTLLMHSDAPIAIGAKFSSVQLGALMHISPDVKSGAREIALLANNILKGAKPGEIPVTTPMEFELGFNVTTAIEECIVIPPDMLELADENVYR